MRITESQLRKIVKRMINEQVMSSNSNQVEQRKTPPSYKQFNTAEEARQHAYSGPLVKMMLFQDPETGMFWYDAKYDTWGT